MPERGKSSRARQEDGIPALHKYWQLASRGGVYFLGLPGARPVA